MFKYGFVFYIAAHCTAKKLVNPHVGSRLIPLYNLSKVKIYSATLTTNTDLFKNPLCNDPVFNNPLYNISNPVGNIMTKKLARFIFPTNDLISKDWVCDDIPNSKSIFNLLNITLDRLTVEERNCWANLAGRDVELKEVSVNGIYKTYYDLKREMSEFKREKNK